MAGPYGTQTPAMPGQAVLGYGPSGQHYNQLNPVDAQGRSLSAAGLGGTARPTGPYAQPAWQNAPQRPYAWTAAGKALAAREQQVYGGDLYGNNAATGGVGQGGNAGGQPGTGSYQTGITAGIIPPSVVQQGYGRMGIQGPGSGTVGNQYNDLMRQGMNQVGTQFARDAAFDMSNLNLAQQRARADAGLGYGNLLARLFEGNLANNRAQQGMTGDFLMGLLG